MPADASKTFLFFKVPVPFSCSPFEHLKGASQQCCVTYTCIYREMLEVVYPENHNALKTASARAMAMKNPARGRASVSDADDRR